MPSDAPPEKPDRNGAQFIGPVDLSPRGKAPSVSRPRRKITLAAVVGLVLVLAVVGGVLLLRHLSSRPVPTGETAVQMAAPEPVPASRVPPSTPPATPKAPEAAAAPPAADAGQTRRHKAAAEEQLAAFLKARRHLEGLGAAQWGGSAYEDIIRLSDEGDARYRRQDFTAAAELYTRAARKAALLADKAPEALAELITRAAAEIETGDGQSARQKLQAALKIDPGNARIAKLLQRADKAEEVQRLLEKGRGLERQGAAEKALTAYGRALQLDPDARRVRAAFARLDSQLALQRYQRFMSEGLAALERREYRRARKLLLKARAARPDSPAAGDALAQAEAALQQERIEALRQRALAAEAAEDWRLALQTYQAVLKMDDKVGFAVDGRKRAAAQINRLQRLDFFLKKPQSLQQERQLEKARQLVHELENAPATGPRALERAGRLKELVKAWETPVAVTIRSDGLTRVAVYRVGRLGRFSVRRIALRPGTYTVVGSRDGYQDVRRQITVRPGLKSLEITIACKTKA